MNTERINELIEALRSGKYTQTTGSLYRVETGPEDVNPGMCCLGVCADLFHEQTGIGYWDTENLADGRAAYLEAGLAISRNAICGVENRIPGHFGLTDLQETTMMKMNDSGRTFNEIADWLEEQLKEHKSVQVEEPGL